MQRKSEDIPKYIRRIHNGCAPDVSRRNLTDTPNDLPERKASLSRRSCMPMQLLPDVQKRMDSERKELELGLLYDEYLQTIMMDLIIKKTTEEKKQHIIAQLATVTHEIEQDTKKLIKIKTREQNIINLSLIQKEVDVQLAAVTKCTKDETFKNARDILARLQSFLEPLDILQCNDIIVPETQDEWEKAQEILTKCSNILKSIMKLIESKGETYCAVNAGLKSFIETYNEIENIQKKLEEALCNLQISTLKNASFSLS